MRFDLTPRIRTALALLVAAAFAAVAAVVIGILGNQSTPSGDVSVARHSTLTAQGTDGRLALSSLRGRPSVLAFEQAGCSDCIPEMRDLATLAPTTPGVRFVALNLPGGGTAQDLASFAAQLGATRAITYLADPDGTIARAYGVTQLDTILVINARGRITARLIRPDATTLAAAVAHARA